MPTGYGVEDANFSTTFALPNGAAVTQMAAGFDTMNGVRGSLVAECELYVAAPALAVGALANGDVITYTVECDDNSGFSSARVLATLGTQTGAGGVGDVAKTWRYRLPTDCERYVRVKATKTGTGNASASSATVKLFF